MNQFTLVTRQTEARAKVASRPIIAYGIFLLCASLYLLPFLRIMLTGTDEGTLLSGAVRVVHGQVFARDFFEVIGPGTFYWLAAFFKIFGVTFLATRIDLWVTSLGTGLVVYFMTRRVCRSYRTLPCILVAATYFGVLWPAISHHVDSNFFALLSIGFIVLWQDWGKAVFLLAAGATAGLTAAIHLPKGILLIGALLCWFAVQRWRRMALLSPIIPFLASVGAVVALILGYFWSQGALGDLIYANYTWPSQNYNGVNEVGYGQGMIRNYWDHWVIAKSGFRWTIPLAIILIVPLIFVAVLPVLLLVLGIAHRRDRLNPTILLYWLSGCALLLSELHRKDIYHLVMGSPVLVVLCVYYLSHGASKTAANLLQVVSICGVCLAGFNLFLALTAHSVATRVGNVAMFQPDPALTYLDNHVRPGEEIFAYPYCPMYYFLSETNNPTHYSIMMYGYNTPTQFEEVVRVLTERKTKYLVWNTGFAKSGIEMFSPSSKWESNDKLIVEPYLKSHYKVVWSNNITLILERIADESTK